jgi:DNA-binding CsgD family transcriptional regulator
LQQQVEQVISKMQLPSLIWLPQEEACATELVTQTLHRALDASVPEALGWGTAQLGFDSFVFGIAANDRRPDAESRAYILTNQADNWVRSYDEHAYVEVDPRVDLAGEPGYAFWEARHFDTNPRHKVFLTEAACHGIQSGLVLGLCTRDPPSYAMMALNCAAPTLDHWSAEERLLIAGQALVLGKVLSRSVRNFLYEEELLFPRPRMKLNIREREILTLAAAGQTSKEIAAVLGIAKITVDIYVGTILTKMGALNRNQAIAKAIVHNLIQLPDDVNAEHKSAKLDATRRAHRTRSADRLSRDGRH